MRKKIIIYLFVLLAFFTLAKYSFAQTPTISITSQCGYGGVPNKDMCCSSIADPNSGTASQEAKTKIPGPFQFANKWLPDANIGDIPFMNNLSIKCYLGEPVGTGAQCVCKQTISPSPVESLKTLCKKFIVGSTANCENCIDGGGILTGIGCIPMNLENFVTDFLLNRLIGLAGIVALLCIIYSSFMMQTSQANPEKIKKAQELLTSCIMGLMLILFSVFILRLIGVDILRIPGFTK